MLRVTTWQRKARLVIAIAAAAFAVAVVFAFKKRDPAASTVPIGPVDPNAAIESAKGNTVSYTGNNEDVIIHYASGKSFVDGTKKLTGVKITTEREGGRTFVMTANQADVSANDKDYSATGDVHLTSSDGLDVRTERADYREIDGMVKAPGAVAIARGRMTASGRGLVYAKNL